MSKKSERTDKGEQGPSDDAPPRRFPGVNPDRPFPPPPPATMSAQDCWDHPMFPAAMLSATQGIYTSRGNKAGTGRIAWDEAMQAAVPCAEMFVRRLAAGPS